MRMDGATGRRLFKLLMVEPLLVLMVRNGMRRSSLLSRVSGTSGHEFNFSNECSYLGYGVFLEDDGNPSREMARY